MLGMKNHSYNHLLFRWRRKCLLRASVGNVYEIRCFATLLLSAWQSSTKCFFFVSLILQLAEKRLLRKIVGNVFTYKILRFTQNDKALLNVFYFVLMNAMKPGTHLLHAEVEIVLTHKMLRYAATLSMTKHFGPFSFLFRWRRKRLLQGIVQTVLMQRIPARGGRASYAATLRMKQTG